MMLTCGVMAGTGFRLRCRPSRAHASQSRTQSASMSTRYSTRYLAAICLGPRDYESVQCGIVAAFRVPVLRPYLSWTVNYEPGYLATRMATHRRHCLPVCLAR
eukprot:2060266-Rhodomonas_salina.3